MENFTCTLEKVQSGKGGFYGGVPTAAATVECGNQRLSVAAAKGAIQLQCVFVYLSVYLTLYAREKMFFNNKSLLKSDYK